MKKILSIVIVMFLFVLVGVACSPVEEKEPRGKVMAYISANANSKYEQTFKELHLGEVFDYYVQMPHADKTWVTLWIEIFRNGEQIDTGDKLAFGIYPNEVEEGQIGFGFISPTRGREQFFFYAPGVYSPLMERDFFVEATEFSRWQYAVGREAITLSSGDEMVLGAYMQGRLGKEYNLNDNQDVQNMLHDNNNVLLLKIKVEERETPPPS